LRNKDKDRKYQSTWN